VTDNEKKMEKMKRTLQQDDDRLIVYGCSSHWLNLLGQELAHSPVISMLLRLISISETIINLVHG